MASLSSGYVGVQCRGLQRSMDLRLSLRWRLHFTSDCASLEAKALTSGEDQPLGAAAGGCTSTPALQ